MTAHTSATLRIWYIQAFLLQINDLSLELLLTWSVAGKLEPLDPDGRYILSREQLIHDLLPSEIICKGDKKVEPTDILTEHILRVLTAGLQFGPDSWVDICVHSHRLSYFGVV